jgi:phosphohistidine phosphatase
MIEVYLQRHGIAEETGPGGQDSARALTAEGKRRLRTVYRRARLSGVRPEVILTSPYKRAIQTAELAAKELGCPGGVHETSALTPASRPEAVWDEIRAHRKVKRILLAGHEPLLSQSAAYLLDSPSLNIDFKKGAIIRIDFESAGAAPRGVLKWMITPSTAG